jgi:hypothetical protein
MVSTSINVSLSVATSVADALGLQRLQGMGFYFTVLFVGFLPQIVVAFTIVYFLVVQCNEHTFTILHNTIFFPVSHLAHEAADSLKCMLYCSRIFLEKCYAVHIFP